MSSQSLSNLSRPNGWRRFLPHFHALRGGTLLIHRYSPEQVALGTGGAGNPDHMYTPDMLADAFPHMQITVNRAYTATLDEGRGHSGPSALIDFVAKG